MVAAAPWGRVGRPDQTLAVDIGRYAQCTDHFVPDVFEGIVVEVEASFYPAIGDAALGDEAPEDLFQHPRKVHFRPRSPRFSPLPSVG